MNIFIWTENNVPFLISVQLCISVKAINIKIYDIMISIFIYDKVYFDQFF